MNDPLVRLLGWRALVYQGDPPLYDRWRWLRRHLRPGPLRTLDAGSGLGAFTMFAASLGNHVVGISFAAGTNAVARHRAERIGLKGITFVDADLRELGSLTPQLGTFDQVLCLETIEHVRDDRDLLERLGGLLREGGRLLLTTPYKLHKPFPGETVSAIEDGGHVRYGYTHPELRDLLEDCGLTVTDDEYIGGVVSRRVTIIERSLRNLHPRMGWAAALPLRLLLPLDRPLTRLLSYPALSVAVVAERRS